MDLRGKFYEIMEKDDSLDELIGKVEELLKAEKDEGNIKDYEYTPDTDVFDSPGLDIFYLSICWIDNNDKLQIAGAGYYKY